MKTIFRLMNNGLILAAVIALATVVGFAQDPCADVDAMNKAQDNFDTLYANKTDLNVRGQAIQAGKDFIDKYGSCEPAKVRVDWLKLNVPKMEKKLADDRAAKAKSELLTRFDNALKTKNWDEVYVSGKEIMAKYPDEYRPTEIVLAAVGGEEAFFRANYKYNDDALKFAKQSIADLEAGKAFTLGTQIRYGLSELKPGTPKKTNYAPTDFLYNFEFSGKEDALGWLNMYIGYITSVAQKNKAAALPYLYKSTLGNTESSKQPTAFGLIGYYYVEQGDKLVDEIKALEAAQSDKDPEDVAKQKIEAIKAKVAISNGTNQRAIDALARAHSLAKDAKYKADIKKAIDFSYNRRFGKMEGLDAWVANSVKQPFENPNTPVTPVSDPEPVTTTTSTTTPPPTTPVTNGKPVTTAPATKPAATPATKPATTPATKPVGTKPSASIKKPVVKKRGAK